MVSETSTDHSVIVYFLPESTNIARHAWVIDVPEEMEEDVYLLTDGDRSPGNSLPFNEIIDSSYFKIYLDYYYRIAWVNVIFGAPGVFKLVTITTLLYDVSILSMVTLRCNSGLVILP